VLKTADVHMPWKYKFIRRKSYCIVLWNGNRWIIQFVIKSKAFGRQNEANKMTELATTDRQICGDNKHLWDWQQQTRETEETNNWLTEIGKTTIGRKRIELRTGVTCCDNIKIRYTGADKNELTQPERAWLLYRSSSVVSVSYLKATSTSQTIQRRMAGWSTINCKGFRRQQPLCNEASRVMFVSSTTWQQNTCRWSGQDYNHTIQNTQ
jgi:hypothetical protein